MAIQYIGTTISGIASDTKPTPTANEKGVIFIETDTNKMFQWDTDSWNQVITSTDVAVGALNSGSITSGFGTIDTGSSDITTTGTVTAGSLSVTGTTTTVSSTNTLITDKIIELANGTSGSPSGDAGIIIERGSSTNAIIAWDESTDQWTVGTTSATGASTGDLTISAGDFVANNLYGTIQTAAQGTITSLGTLTALQVDNLNINLNTITATSGAVNITPAAGSAIVLDGTISIDAGVVTGATSITSTAFVGALTGDVTGNASGTAATVTGATQAAITSIANLATVGTITTGVWNAGAVTSSGVVTATGFTIGNAVIAEAELEMIDGITAGTAAASKALVVDASKNIATIGTIGSGAITATGTSSFATAVQTPLIEYTDGDDSMTIADGGKVTFAAGFAVGSDAAGDILYHNGTSYVRLAKGTADQILTMNDGATAPGWEDAAAGGATIGQAIAMAIVFGGL